MVAKHGDWWVKVGTDRLVLVQRTAAAAFALTPPGDSPEALVQGQAIPYVTPLPGVTLTEWKQEPHFELTGKQDPELRVLGPAVQLHYAGPGTLSPLEIQTRYNDALQHAGWNVVRSDVGGVTGAHNTAHGRDVWAKITPSNSTYVIEVADLGLAAQSGKLASALADQGHVALYGIYFDTDKATLKPESEATLQQVRALLVAQPALKLEVQGHTDNTSTPAHNQKLSEDRAASVDAWLVAHGIDGARLVPKGYAASKPVADNATPQGRALNRRVELARP
jgi:outer membrane protein OmpA-like peptidoglycan-associated protein